MENLNRLIAVVLMVVPSLLVAAEPPAPIPVTYQELIPQCDPITGQCILVPSQPVVQSSQPLSYSTVLPSVPTQTPIQTPVYNSPGVPVTTTYTTYSTPQVTQSFIPMTTTYTTFSSQPMMNEQNYVSVPMARSNWWASRPGVFGWRMRARQRFQSFNTFNQSNICPTCGRMR